MAEELRRICPTCGKEFVTTDPRKKSCTVKCRLLKAYRKYNALHRVERTAKLRQWRAEHRELYLQQNRKYRREVYYPKNKQRILAKNKEYKLNNPDKVKGYQHKYYVKNKSKKKAYMEEYLSKIPNWEEKYKPVNRYRGKLLENETVSYYKDFNTCVGFVIRNTVTKKSKWVLHTNKGKILTESETLYSSVKLAKQAMKNFMK